MDTVIVHNASLWGLAGQWVTIVIVLAALVAGAAWCFAPLMPHEKLGDGPEDEILEAQREGQQA